MADTKKDKPAEGTNQKDNSPDTDAPQSGRQDATVAEAAGITEGELKALRSDAGLNQSAGHEANVLAWEASPAGQQFLAQEKERQEQVKRENKEAEESAKQVDEATEKYRNAVEDGRKAIAKQQKSGK